MLSRPRLSLRPPLFKGISQSTHKGARALTMSYVEGPREPPLVSDTLWQYFTKEIMQKHSTRQALISRHEKPRPFGGPESPNMGVTQHLAWNFEEFNRHIEALARGLVSLGVKKGDRVGIVMGNSRCVDPAVSCNDDSRIAHVSAPSAYAAMQWACASIGAILVTLNPAYRLNEFVRSHLISNVSCDH